MLIRGVTPEWGRLFDEHLPGYDPMLSAEGYVFNADEADMCCAFFPGLMTHIEGKLAGQPFNLEDWQKAIVGCVFGWRSETTGFRRYREVFQYVPRKNGKTTFLGALVNFIGLCDPEPGSQIYSAAADRDQAALIYRQAKGMLLSNEDLAKRVTVYASFKSIDFGDNRIYKALSSESDTKHGLNVHFAAVDELHAMPNADLVEVLQTGMGAREEPIMWYITTADYQRESVCNDKLRYAKQVRDAIVEDPAFLPVIYAADKDDDWTDRATWAKANPNMGVSISEEYLSRECIRAQDSPAYENTFKRLHLNMPTEQAVRWLQMAAWDECDGVVDVGSLKGKSCYAGLDLSSTRDITALVLVFPGETMTVLPYFFVPGENAVERARRDRVPYDLWARQGFLELTEGNVVDYEHVRKRVNEIAGEFGIRELAIDRLFQGAQLSQQLQDDGMEVYAYPQSFMGMAAPAKELETLVLQRAINHGGNPVLRWMASNVSVKIDENGNMKPDKKKSTEKIDGIVALVMAIGRMLVGREPEPSPYEGRGVVFI